MEFTGERFTTDQHGDIELEHLHRYICASKLASGKDVLDIASGEGYGAAILAERARSVVGVDISDEAVKHAQQRYAGENLSYRTGSATAIPLPDASIDLVVSFETIEHHDRHDAMIAEIKRVLRPDGVLIMSSPDKRVYSLLPNYTNPYHVKELTRDEFDALIRGRFANVDLYGQRVIYASGIAAERGASAFVNYRNDDGNLKSADGLIDPMYLIAVASEGLLPKLASGIFEGQLDDSQPVIHARRALAEQQTSLVRATERGDALEVALSTIRADTAKLDATVREQDEALREKEEALRAAHDQIARRRDSEEKLKRENVKLEASVAKLRETSAELTGTVQALRSSWSWRLSRPLRAMTTVLRKVKNAVLMPVRIARASRHPTLMPVKQLQALANGAFLSTGDDPQFAVHPGWRPLTGGWALATIDIVDAQNPMQPILYVFSGEGGSHVTAYAMPHGARGRVRKAIVLPVGVQGLRLDPTDKEGVQFSMGRATVRNLGRLGLLRYGYSLLDQDQRKQVVAAALRGDFATVKTTIRDRLISEDHGSEYRAWVEQFDTLTGEDQAAIRTKVEQMRAKPLISIAMPVYNPRPKYLRKALDSVLAQIYPNWELCIADDASTNPEIRQVLTEYAQRDSRIKVAYRTQNGHISAATNTAIELVAGDFIALMDHDDALPAHALYMVADELIRHPETDLIYTDEDKVDEQDRRHDAHFKTDWNPELFYAQNLIAHMGVYRTAIVRKIGGFRIGFEGSQDYDFALRFLKHTDATRIRHIPHVLYHWRIFPGVASFSTNNPNKSIDTAHRALKEYFADVEPDAEVVPIEQFPSWWRIRRQPPAPLPRVSLIVPTRDRLDVLKVAVQGLLHETNYDNLELIIVDNDSVEPDTLDYFASLKSDQRVKILKVEGPFNFSQLNNCAAAAATGSILGFVNNDVKVIDADWLVELVAQVSRPNVGAAGAKLYYANETIQHAGVILGLYGVAAHGHRHFPRNSIGYFGRPMLVQNISAVTAACMVVPKDVFDQVGGYDEVNLTVGYNDVDLCLKIREASYDIVFTPFSELYHLESVSRGENLTPAQLERDARERAYMLERWGGIIERDPFYNPNLTVGSENFGLAFPPRAAKPWLDS